MNIVLYSNINQIPNEKVDYYLKLLPEFMREDILKYRLISDQKSHLVSRLMLKHLTDYPGSSNSLQNWERITNQKPRIKGWIPFNISYSSELVVLGYGVDNIGIDIERKRDGFNYQVIFDYLHPAERKSIMSSKNTMETFFRIWVRKGAFFKAIGKGITGDLQKVNCLPDIINHEGLIWYFNDFNIDDKYASCLCSTIMSKTTILKTFNHNLY